MHDEEVKFTSKMIRELVERDIERLFAHWLVGRSENYAVDSATKNIIAIGYWLDEQLSKICNDADRRTQCWKFNRMSRTYDIWETAAECINEAIEGSVEQNRVGHRRWG